MSIFDRTTITVTVHVHLAPEDLRPALGLISTTLKELAMNQDEFTVALNASADKAEKVAAEVTAAIADMAAAIAAAGSSTPAQDAALARLNGALTVADDLNPDAPAGEVVAP